MKFLILYDPMLNKKVKKKNREKSENVAWKIQEKNSNRMAHGRQQLKFNRNPPNGFRDNCDTNDGRTTDRRRMVDDRQILIS